MVIRQKTSRDHRRRRALADERSQTVSRNTVPPVDEYRRKKGRARRYADAALANRQPRIFSFVPRRPWTLTMWFLVGLAFVLAHASVFALQSEYAPSNLSIDLAPLQLVGARAMSNWTSSLILMLAAVFSGMVLQIRRHRIDDYRGDYRVWYYFIAALVLASVNASTATHLVILQVAELGAATFSIQHATGWMNGLISVVVTGLVVRILVEIRPSRGTVTVFVAASMAYACRALLSVGIIALPSSELATLAVGLSRLLGHYLLLMSLVVYLRYVFLDAQGLIVEASSDKKKRQGKAAGDESALDAASSSRESTACSKAKTGKSSFSSANATSNRSQTSLPEAKKTEEKSASTAAPANSADAKDDDQETGEPDTLQLSKAERRRLRKQKRRERKAA